MRVLRACALHVGDHDELYSALFMLQTRAVVSFSSSDEDEAVTSQSRGTHAQHEAQVHHRFTSFGSGERQPPGPKGEGVFPRINSLHWTADLHYLSMLTQFTSLTGAIPEKMSVICAVSARQCFQHSNPTA